MASSRQSGPSAGALVPLNFTFHGSSGTSSLQVSLPEGMKFKVGRITVAHGAVTGSSSISLGDNGSGTRFVNAQAISGASGVLDIANAASVDAEYTATGGTSTLICTMTTATSVVNCVLTCWLWITTPPTVLSRR